MAHQKRLPPIRLLVEKNKFNKIVEILSLSSDLFSEDIKIKSTKLKDKLLKYSIPREDENGELKVDIRFYINEAEDLLFLLIGNFNELDVSQDYFELLKKSSDK